MVGFLRFWRLFGRLSRWVSACLGADLPVRQSPNWGCGGDWRSTRTPADGCRIVSLVDSEGAILRRPGESVSTIDPAGFAWVRMGERVRIRLVDASERPENEGAA